MCYIVGLLIFREFAIRDFYDISVFKFGSIKIDKKKFGEML